MIVSASSSPILHLVRSLPELIGWLAAPERSFIAKLVREAGLESGDHLLDVGCGTGHVLKALARTAPGAALVGLDPDEDALELASRKMPRTATPVKLSQGIGQDMEFGDDCFDVVAATLLFENLAGAEQGLVLSECYRVLKPAGRLLVADRIDSPTALVNYSLESIQRIATGAQPAPALDDLIVHAGFDPPETLDTSLTLTGRVRLIECYKPRPPRA